MVWYSHLFKNFPQFVVIYTVKGFSIVSETEVDVFLKFSCFFYDLTDIGKLISYYNFSITDARKRCSEKIFRLRAPSSIVLKQDLKHAFLL